MPRSTLAIDAKSPLAHPGASGETIHWMLRDSALGLLAMAVSARGVCFAQFGADAAVLEAELTHAFPNATLLASPTPPVTRGAGADRANADDPAHRLGAWIGALDALLSRSGPALDLPLDLRGTVFQMRVWRFLQSIPRGSTRSYAEVAQAIGTPKAVRAVGSACGANRVAVLVPCHRVLRGDGSLGGFRSGLERKAALLQAEANAPAL